MKVVHLDYVWTDGFEPPQIRSKTKISALRILEDGPAEIEIGPWNFDGSSTGQATTRDSEKLLIPVRVYQVSQVHYVVLCEVCDTDGSSHESNYRASLREYLEKNPENDMWVGFEQEYFLTNEESNMLWSPRGEPIKDPRYYCSVGGDRVMKRGLIRNHANVCHQMGIQIVGYNAEVAPAQWEFQCFAKNALQACDDLWVARYMLSLLAEVDNTGVEWDPKPHKGWNGSGCHTNFSTDVMRNGEGGEEMFTDILNKMSNNHATSMECYGEGNKNRLLGAYETAHWSQFTYGVADRGASVRIPTITKEADWKGYLEDRRPASNCDPYRVVGQLVKCV